MNEIIITKKISKQGDQNMILIPTFLKERLKPRTLVEVKIRILEEM